MTSTYKNENVTLHTLNNRMQNYTALNETMLSITLNRTENKREQQIFDEVDIGLMCTECVVYKLITK